jgi:hypothetical protein
MNRSKCSPPEVLNGLLLNLIPVNYCKYCGGSFKSMSIMLREPIRFRDIPFFVLR